MKSILVTGGAGFIGSNLCKRLLDQGEKVVAIDNLITSDGSNLKQFQNNPSFLFIKHDITVPFSPNLSSKISDVKLVYHLACPTGVPNLLRLGEEMLKACSLGTTNILEVAKNYNAGLVFTSSSEVYGDPNKSPQNEEYSGNVNPTGIRSTYEEGKRFSEALCALYFRKYNLDVKIVRVFNTYGPGSSPNETRVVPKFLRLVLENKPLPIHGGEQTRTFCYIDDLINGLLLTSKKGKSGEIYNLGSNKQVTILDLALKIIKITHSKSKVKRTAKLRHDHLNRKPDLAKIKGLGWKQKVTLNKGLMLTLNNTQNFS